MAVEFKNPWMGVILPSGLIATLHLTLSYLMYWDSYFSFNKLLIFNASVFMIYFSYYLAIVTPAGSPHESFEPNRLDSRREWIKYCTKCQNYKPERSHHCRRCGKCVLKMDHHCPWTNNCIGYNNTPHFFRFVCWVVSVVGFGFYYSFTRLFWYYKSWDLPAYLFNPKVFALILFDFVLTGFVLLTVGILLLRTINQLAENKTMIEDWELDRIQDKFFDEKFWVDVKENYKKFNNGDDLPNLSSWKVNYRVLKKNSIIPNNFSFDDFTFPYDLGSWYENFVDAMGPIYLWFFPWGKPRGNGMKFLIDALDEDQIKLPFPPDGCDYDPPNGVDSKGDTVERDDDNETIIKTWSNYLGETLNDFGVDLDTEVNNEVN